MKQKNVEDILEKINLRLVRNAVRCIPDLQKVLTSSEITILVTCKEIQEALKYAIKCRNFSSFFKITNDEIICIPTGSKFIFKEKQKKSRTIIWIEDHLTR